MLSWLPESIAFRRHSPDSRPIRPDPPSLEVPPQPNSIATASVRGQTAGVPVRESRTRRFSVIKAHLCRRRPSRLTRFPVHAGAGGGRNRAISNNGVWRLERPERGQVTLAEIGRSYNVVRE